MKGTWEGDEGGEEETKRRRKRRWWGKLSSILIPVIPQGAPRIFCSRNPSTVSCLADTLSRLLSTCKSSVASLHIARKNQFLKCHFPNTICEVFPVLTSS